MGPNAPRAPLAAAILAGGAARRLGGANKALLRIGAVRIIDRQLALVRQLTSDIFIVAPDPAPYDDLCLPVVPDEVPGAGALGGILTALAASPCPRTLVLACDLPFVSIALLRLLEEAPAADLAIPRRATGYEPLCAVYMKTCIPAIRARIERGDLQAAALTGDVRVAEIGPEVLAAYDPDDLLFLNVNTPHDYARARSAVELKPEPAEDRNTE